MTATWYLIREILRPFAFILGILAALFASYCAAGILADAVDSLLPTNTLLITVGLKTLISLEVLIPISLLISVVLALGRLHSDSEITAMYALSISPRRVMGAVLGVSGGLAILVGALSLFARPWSYHQLHDLSKHAGAMLNVKAMQPGTFYIDQGGKRVIWFGRRGPGLQAHQIFIRLRYPDHEEIIHAKDAASLAAALDQQVELRDAHIYTLGSKPGVGDKVIDAGRMTANPNGSREGKGRYDIAAMPSAALLGSAAPGDVAELQWRLSTAVSTLLLGMLGMPLGRVRPRQGRYAKFGTAILIYAGYYLLCMSARTWVAQGAVAPVPGLWWVPGLLALTVVMALYPPRLAVRRPA